MGSFISDLKNNFQRGNISLQLIYINVGIFVVTTLVSVILMLFNWGDMSWMNFLQLPAYLPKFLVQPWTLFTYMFLHAGVLHLLFNMLWLYWFGRMFLSMFSARHFRGLYLLGASASVLAIVVATAVREPEYRVNFMFIGAVRLKYVALFMVVTDLLFVTSGNGGGHIAHLGGALAGWWFAKSLQKGHDITRWINQVFDWFSGGIKISRPAKKPKMKVNRGGKADDYDYNARKKQQSEEIDRILDKLKQSGYASLTTEEKKRLFDASKK